ncbi:Ger(x)C family spore germination protein [Cohnella boryungensis]|uniref:Ger(X)C family spore germination protein n=1 Tax=Cohnella boryungensis TaxID=768479 RepID=A0ABV8SC61_9BACL
MKGRRWIWGTVAALALLSSGCKGNVELNELHIVHAVAVDVGKKGGVRVSAEISELTTGGQQPKGMQNRTFLLTGEGKTLFEAARYILDKSDRTLLWGQTSVIIISKAAASRDFDKQIESIRRFRQFRNTTMLFMIDGTASEVLEVAMPNSAISGQALRGLSEGGESTALTTQTTLLDIYRDQINKYRDILVPSVNISKKERGAKSWMLQTVGFFAFSDNKLAGYMGVKESKGYMRAANLMRGAVEEVACGGASSRTVTFENTISKSRITAKLDKDGAPVAHIEIDADLNLVGIPCEDTDVTPGDIADWEKRLNAEIESEVEDFLAASQRRKTDLLGIGENLHRRHPKQWSRVKERWAELYPTCRFTVRVRTRIDHTNFTT